MEKNSFSKKNNPHSASGSHHDHAAHSPIDGATNRFVQTIKNQSPLLSMILFLGGVLWTAALWLPVFMTPQGEIKGYWVLATGWVGFVFFQLSWYANLILPVAIILIHRSPVLSTVVAGIGLLVATQAFWLDSIPGSVTNTPILSLGYGFWLWYASMLLLGLAVMFGSDGAPATTSVSPSTAPLLPKHKK